MSNPDELPPSPDAAGTSLDGTAALTALDVDGRGTVNSGTATVVI